MVVVLAREQQRGALPAEFGLERFRVPVELGFELGIGGLVEELDGGLEVGGTREQATPRLDLGAQAIGLAQDLLGGPLVVPEPGAWVSASSSATRSVFASRSKAPRGRPDPFGQVADGGRVHLVPGLEILEQERTQLDEPQRGLASGDDGVHAGTVAVMRTYAAIAPARLCPSAASVRESVKQAEEASFVDLIACERDCRNCSYAAALDCDGNCGVCPHNGYCPCVNPVVARSKTALRLIELRPILLQDLRVRN